ncbi:MAG TPA: hypothetical protein VFZ56_09815 [Gemmatimonadaceae bacterium]
MSVSDPSRPVIPDPPPVTAPQGRPFAETREFGTAAVLGVFAVGALIGAAVMLLTPQAAVTRGTLGRRLRRLAGRDRSTWDRLHRTLNRAARQRRAARRAAKLAAVEAATGT